MERPSSSDRVNALDLALNKPKGESPFAGCPGCAAPLIGTMAFSGAEWYCLECGRHVSYVGPVRLEPNDETRSRYEALQAEWDEHAGSKLMPRGAFWKKDCPQCASRPAAGHLEHATQEEIEADELAREWLKERVA
jgi:transposase